MAARKPTMTEQKLVTLYALYRLGRVTALQLLRFMVENEMMDYIALQLSITDLEEMGFLRKIPHTLGALYAPSAKGYEALRMFNKRIPHSRASKIDGIAHEWKTIFNEEKQLLSDWEIAPSGEYLVRLRLMDGETALLDMRVSLPSRELANRFCKRWPRAAGELYAKLMRTLGEE